jgi:galactonate dehydratase
VSNWGLSEPEGPYEDLDAFLHRADELAEDLLSQGTRGMKIWPFDSYAEATDGHYISEVDLQRGLGPFRKIREAAGTEMDVMVEFHSLWDLPTAQRIARALEEFEPYWFEDPLKADDLDALAEFASSTDVPVTASETLSGRPAFRELMEKGAAKIVMLDVSWCGGVSEAKKIATMAEAHHLPVAPHDCTGPVVLTASTHLSINLPNALTQETVRAYYTGWYKKLVTELPVVSDGHVSPRRAQVLAPNSCPTCTSGPTRTSSPAGSRTDN